MSASHLQEVFGRMDIAEKNVKTQGDQIQHLEGHKTDKNTFYKVKKKLEMKDLEQDIKLFKCINHCVTLDNYLEKYLPIRC